MIACIYYGEFESMNNTKIYYSPTMDPKEAINSYLKNHPTQEDVIMAICSESGYDIFGYAVRLQNNRVAPDFVCKSVNQAIRCKYLLIKDGQSVYCRYRRNEIKLRLCSRCPYQIK